MKAPERWIGLIAGDGDLPRAAVQEARRRSLGVVVVYVGGLGGAGRRRRGAAPGPPAAPPGDGPWVKRCAMPLSHWDAILEHLKRAGVTHVFALGKVNRLDAATLFEQAASGEGRTTYQQGRTKSDQDLSRLFADSLERHGLRVGSQDELLAGLRVEPGVLSSRAPDGREAIDVDIGRRLGQRIAALDVGQTVVVKDGVILAVEAAVEGTDATIRRAGRLGGPGAVVVKQARRDQDRRFDCPVVGPATIAGMKSAGASCLAFQASACFVLRKEWVVRGANRAGIAVVAF